MSGEPTAQDVAQWIMLSADGDVLDDVAHDWYVSNVEMGSSGGGSLIVTVTGPAQRHKRFSLLVVAQPDLDSLARRD